MKGRDSMGYDGSLKFLTKIDESGFNAGIDKLGTIAKGGLKVLASAVAGVTAAMGTGVVAGVKYNASIEQYQTSFEVMTGSAEKAVEVIERLKEVGAETPFELNNLADVTQLLMNYGFTADEAMDKMMMLGDISQGSADKMQRIATAYGQMSSAGKVSLEDVKQMIEAGFNPLQEIYQSTGESMASLYQRISDGAIAVDEITASMQRATSEGGKYFQSMEKQSQTTEGLISTLKDNAMQLLGEVVQPITESFRTELLPTAIDIVEQLSSAFAENGVDGLIEAGGKICANLTTGVAENLPMVIDTAVNIISSFITSLGENTPQILAAGLQIAQSLIDGVIQIGKTLYSVGGTLLATFVSGLSEQLPTLVPQAFLMVATLASSLVSTDNLSKVIDAGVALLEGLITGIVNSLPILIAEGPRIVNDFCDAIFSVIGNIVKLGFDLIVSLVKGLWDNRDLLAENAGEIFMMFLNIFSLSKLFSLGKNLVTSLKEGIKKLGPNIVTEGKNLLKNLVIGIKNFATHPVSTIKEIITNAFNAVKNMDWKNLGKNILDGIINGIKKNASKIIDSLIAAAGAALNGVKEFLGIHSPSTVFRDQIGKNMALGMGVGFDKNIPVDDMTGALSNSVQKMQKRVSTVTQESGANVANRVTRLYGFDNPNGKDDPEEINVYTTNVFEVDGTTLVEKTTKATIQKINRSQKENRKVRGQQYEAVWI